MLRQFTVGGIAALVAIVVATMAATVSPTEAAKCTRTCQWKCNGISLAAAPVHGIDNVASGSAAERPD
jgi:hypothetical protein